MKRNLEGTGNTHLSEKQTAHLQCWEDEKSMTNSLNIGGNKMTIPEMIAQDIIHALLCHDTEEKAAEIADMIAALFEFTGNGNQLALSLVCKHLQGYADAFDMTPDEFNNLIV